MTNRLSYKAYKRGMSAMLYMPAFASLCKRHCVTAYYTSVVSEGEEGHDTCSRCSE
jgi:hypothetical protein